MLQQVALRDQRVHPGPAALGVARVQVEHVEPDPRAVGVGDLEDASVRVVGDQVATLGERDPVELGRREEDAVLQDALGLEPRAERSGVDVELRLPHLLGVERPVGRLEHLVRIHRVEVGLLLAGVLRGRGRERGQHLGDGLRRAGGLVGGDGGRVAGEAQQRGAIRPQPRDLEDELAVVEVAPVGSAGTRRRHEAPPKLAMSQRREVRMPGRQHEREQPALEFTVGGRLRGRRELSRVEAVELGDVGDVHGQLVRVGQQILLELGGQGRDALVEVLERLLLGVVEPGACQGHLGVPALDQVLLLGREARSSPADRTPSSRASTAGCRAGWRRGALPASARASLRGRW